MVTNDLELDPFAARLIALAGHVPGAIRQTLGYVDRLDQAATRLEGHTCTGSPYWRDKDANGKQPKLYVIHHIDRFCPLHGMPEPGQRVRVYIGSDEARQAVALAHIADEDRRRQLVSKRDALNRKLVEAGAALQHLLEELGYDPQSGEAQSRALSFTVEELLAL